MNEVLQDGSNKSPLLSGEAAHDESAPAKSLAFDDSLENHVDVNPVILTEIQTKREIFSSGVTRPNMGSFQENQRKIIPSSGSFNYQTKKETLTQRQQALFLAEKNKQLANKNNEDFKTDFTLLDKTKIVGYHLIEPILLGSMIGTSLQISQLETMIYLMISFLIIMPMLLTNDLKKIKIKRTLCFIIITLAMIFLLFKFWVYYQFTETSNLNSNKYLTIFLGVDHNQWAATFVTDIITIFLGLLLIWHYYSQIFQLEAREKQQGTLKYQMKILFFHYLLGQTAQAFYLIAFILFLVDTFFYQTIVQVLILMVQIGFLYVWSVDIPIPSKLQNGFIRTTQVLTFTFLVISFLFSMPKIFNSFILNHPELFQFFGLEQIVQETLQPDGLSVIIIWQTSVHKFLLSYAIVMTEVYFTCKKVNLDSQAKEKAAAVARELAEQQNRQPWTNQLVLASGSQIQNQRAIKRLSKLNTLTASGKQKQGLESLTMQIEKAFEYLQSSICLWSCRILCFIWVYLYHDIQSLIILVWILHSSLFQNSLNFSRCTSYLYLPLMMLIFLFYYCINIYGVYCQSSSYQSLTVQEQRRLYTFGIYPFRFASLECAFMFLTLFSIAIYTRQVYIKKTRAAIDQQQDLKNEGVFNVLNFNRSTFAQLNYLALVYIKYPIFLLLIMSGLGKMDFYHIFLLFVFVWAALYPQAFERNIIWLLIYADFFVFAKYTYTLITKQTSPQKPWMWLSIVGISAQYDPQTTREYFRYQPQVDQWLLVILAYAQYRRANLIGTDFDLIQKNEENILTNLSKKYPGISKVTRFIGVLLNHGVVIITFLGYLLTLTFMRRSILNLVSFVLLLLLLASYLIYGIKTFLKQWPIFGFYQAFVLLSILAYQFSCQSPGLADYPFYKEAQARIGPYGSALIYWAGYYKFSTPIWYYFLPYVLMFFFAIILTDQFKKKAQHEAKELQLSERQPSDEIQIEDEDNMGQINQSRVLIEIQRNTLSQSQKQIDHNLTPSQIRERFYDMQYKLQYLLWKLKVIWPVFDAISVYFNLILSSVILAFALYFQIAIVWLIYLLIFLVQTFRLYQNHMQYKNEQYERFINLQQSNLEIKQMRTISALQARNLKLTLDQETESSKIITKILKNDSQKMNTDFNSKERLIITDEQVIEEYKIYKSSIHLVSLKSRGFYWATQYIILTAAFTLVYLGAFVPTQYKYPPNAPVQQTVSPIQDPIKSNKLLFVLFASGLYSDVNTANIEASLDNRRELMSDYFPFFILLFLLIIEKLCQVWLENQFNTDEKTITMFERIEQDYRQLRQQELSQEKKQQTPERRRESVTEPQLTEPIKTDPSLASESLQEEEKLQEDNQQQNNSVSGQTQYYSLRTQKQQQQTIQFEDLLNEGVRKVSIGNRDSFQVLDDEADQGYSARFTYNPNSSAAVQTKKEMMAQIKPRLQVKSQIKFELAMRALFVELIIMLVWFSCIYKQSVLSFFLFFALVFHTYSQDSNKTLTVVGLTVFTIFVLEYLLALASLSSYNSPQALPFQITQLILPDNSTKASVYPNDQHYYFSTPLYFKLSQNTTAGQPTINVQFWSFFNFYINGQRLNGIWIDFAVIALAFVYLNLYNQWILQEPIKIISSSTTNELIRSYYDLSANKKNERNEDQLRRELAAENPQNRAIKGLSSILYTNFSLLLIMFVLFISIFAKSLLSLGYFIFSMLLIYNNRSFFKDSESPSSQIYILKYWLMPYLLLDILLQLVLEIPINKQADRLMQRQYLGYAFKEVWLDDPKFLTFGQNVTVTSTLQSSMVALFLKGMLYFMISLQILIVTSMGFKRFSDNILIDNVKNANLIGKGIAYRFNNFKNKRVLASARDYGLMEKMLYHVKQLLKRRSNMYKKMYEKNAVKKAKIKTEQIIVEEEEKNEDDGQIELEVNRIDNQIQMKEYRKNFKLEVETEYKKRLEQLDIGSQIYLWMRRNYVQDILFKHSDDHLIDMVAQFEQGRTSIRTQIEIGILMQTKLDWLKEKQTQVEEKAKQTSLKEDQELADLFQAFRREQIALMEPKPWERLSLRTFRTTKKLILNYLVMFYKILASYTHFFCYFFMMLALFANGGLLYLVYPFIIFGIAMMEERRPGRIFWYFVIVYTQILIILQFIAQLEIWNQSQAGPNIINFSNRYNIGIKKLDNDNFSTVVKQFYPEILILVFVLLHIQQETLAGLFDVSLEDYESFQDGLDRYIRIVLATDAKSLKIYQEEQISKKIQEGIGFDQAFVFKRRNSAPDQLYPEKDLWSADPQWLHDADEEIVKFPLEPQRISRKALSLVDRQDLQNLAERVKIRSKQSKWDKTKSFFESNLNVFWNNQFFDRLFPIIKQQKPGVDLYVWIALIEIFLCFFIIIWFPKLTNEKNSTIAQQIQSNQLQGPMVVALFVLIGIAVVDRIFYTTFAFFNRKAVNKRLNIDAPLISQDSSVIIADEVNTVQRSTINSNFVQNYAINQTRSESQYVPRSVQQLVSDTERSQSIASSQNLQLATNPNDITMANNEELDQKEQHAYYQSLLPQENEKGIIKVLKFYWYWAVLILVHWYIFLHLAKQEATCPMNQRCNLINNNPTLMVFYIIFCIYFMVGAYQIQVGLPELKKGGFMQGEYNSVSKIIYETWYYIPFLFELRTIIDWTFTSTALDVFQSIKLAQAQSDLYIAKCFNKPYMAKELGSEIKWYMKALIGVTLTAFILLLIGGPILLFSTFNPVSTPNPVTAATLSVQIEIKNGSLSTFTIPLFETRQVTKLSTLTQQQYDQFQFGQATNTQTNQFKSNQVQLLQFGRNSDTVWLISPPNLQLLNSALIAANYTPPQGNSTDETEQTVNIILQSDFTRNATQASKGYYKKPTQLDNSTSPTIVSLLNAIQCLNQNGNSINSGSIELPIAIELLSGAIVEASPVTQPNISSGVNLTYFCDVTSNATNYWSLAPIYPQNTTDNQTNPFYNDLVQNFNANSSTSGFGLIVFSQTVLPSYLAAYSSSVIFFYAAVVYVVASAFRSAFVPVTSQIFITDAVLTEDILMVCQCVYIYRVQRNHKNEEELYMILMDILRSPETIKSISGPSLKKELD